GSWWNDLLPYNTDNNPDPRAVTFKLSIHADIPVGPTSNYSMPGQELWSEVFQPGSFSVADPIRTDETFMNPPANIIGTDTQAFTYTFFPVTPFIQQQGTIYWLDVQALPNVVAGVAAPVFGWKTSLYHWNDDAVFGITTSSNFPGTADNWTDMHYPSNSPYAGQSIDMAFDLTTIPEPSLLLLVLPAALMIRSRRVS
ncbi:MAG TPA: hypothetical protein VG722_05170, partial [Tepidisphaeraceae bacterium]|nr:hypothetical protein [Tepidisphaeraceae bacterium]